MPNFDIILVSWNRKDYLKRTVASLIASGAYEACSRFIIVDNHSMEEGIKEFLDTMRLYRKVFITTRPDNNGWAQAVNDGIGLSRSEFVLLVNNDVEFEFGCMDQMFETFAHQNGIGILGAWHHTSHSFVGVSNQWFKEMDNVPAVAWLMPKSAMEKVGILTEHGPCLTKGGNGEDTTYVNRMREAGYLVGVTAKDLATHIDGY